MPTSSSQSIQSIADGKSTAARSDWSRRLSNILQSLQAQIPQTPNAIGQIIFGITAAELAAGVTPVNYAYPPYTLLRYGADPTGVTDATTALQNAINSAQKAQYATVLAGALGAKFKIYSAWTTNLAYTGIDFQGAYLDASGFAGAAWCSVISGSSSDNVNLRGPLNRAHPFKNATIIGPGVATSPICFLFNDTTGNGSGDFLYSITCSQLGLSNWGTDVSFQNGAFCICFEHCDFSETAGTATTYSVINNTPSNSGERLMFFDCFWTNKKYIYNSTNGNSDNYLIACSLDAATRAVYCQGGKVYLNNCHLETSNDSDNYLYATGVNSVISLKGGLVVFDVARNNFALAYSDSSCTWGGVWIDDIDFAAPSGYNGLPLIAGTGNARATNVRGIGTAAGQPNYYSAAQNVFGDQNFQNNSLTRDGWTTSGGVVPTVVTGHGYNSNTYAVQFNPGSTQTSILTSPVFPCKPAQQAACQIFAEFPTFNTGASFTAQLSYVDEGGHPLTSVVGSGTSAGMVFMNLTAAVAAYTGYTSASSGGLGVAPPGTVGVQIQLVCTGGSAAGATGYLGQIMMTVD